MATGRATFPSAVLAIWCSLYGAVGRSGAATIETIAGGGAGDGLPANRQAVLPNGVAVDPAGNVFVADGQHGRVRRVDAATGIVTTVAGKGPSDVHTKPAPPYFCGDGGPATAACLDYPAAVARDAAGNLFIADSRNGRVRRVDASTGIISTIAGNGTPGTCGDGRPAVDACLDDPIGLAIDADGRIAIATRSVVRRVDTNGTISTVAGGGAAPCDDGTPAADVSFDYISGLSADAAGNIFIADAGNSINCRVDAVSHLASRIPNDIPCGTGAIAVDPTGNVFFGSRRLCRLDAGTGTATAIAGNLDEYCAQPDADEMPASAACVPFEYPIAFTPDGSPVIGLEDRVGRVDLARSTVRTVAGNGTPSICGEGGPATNACLEFFDRGFAVDPRGNLFIPEATYGRVWRVDGATRVFATAMANDAESCTPYGATDTCLGGAPIAVVVTANGDLLIAIGGDAGEFVRRLDTRTGRFETIAGGGAGIFCGDGGRRSGHVSVDRSPWPSIREATSCLPANTRGVCVASTPRRGSSRPWRATAGSESAATVGQPAARASERSKISRSTPTTTSSSRTVAADASVGWMRPPE
ncbi:MAG TPA: hypothetical protein VKA21_04965 [Candidatus Binatia bacterium]|nr:hypothetical protein [Candidatus Binatia bacterium]